MNIGGHGYRWSSVIIGGYRLSVVIGCYWDYRRWLAVVIGGICVAICGYRFLSVVIVGLSVVILFIGDYRWLVVSGYRWSDVVIGGCRWLSVAVGGYRWFSVIIGGDRWLSVQFANLQFVNANCTCSPPLRVRYDHRVGQTL